MISISKIGEKLIKDLIPCHSSVLEFGMHTYIVHTIQVIFVNLARAVSIEFEEGFIYYCLTFRIENSSNSYEELSEINASISIFIKER